MSATLAPFPKFRAFDSNGNPLVGGKLYTYEASSTTPLATYPSEDATPGTENQNPTILDANGEANVWLTANNYKLVLKDANDVVQWTVDDIEALPLAFQTLNNVRYASQFSGADIFAKANAAIADIGAHRGKVVIDPGVYAGVATTLSITQAGIEIVAEGADITYSGSGNAIEFLAQDIGWWGGTLRKSGASGSSVGLAIGASPSTTSHHAHVHGLKVIGADPALGSSDRFDTGILGQLSYYIGMYDVDVSGCATYNWRLTNNATSWSLVNCHGRGSDYSTKISQYGIRIDDAGNVGNPLSITSIGGVFEGNTIENCEISGGDYCQFLANHFEQMTAVALGSATFTNGSTAITSVGLFSASHVGKYIKLDADTARYWVKIASVTNANAAVLKEAYRGTSATGASSIVGGNVHIVNGNTDCTRACFIDPDLGVQSGTAPGIYVESGNDHRVIAQQLALGVTLGASSVACNIDGTTHSVDVLDLGTNNFIRGCGGNSNGPDIQSTLRIFSRGNSRIPFYSEIASGQTIDQIQVRTNGGSSNLFIVGADGSVTLSGPAGGAAVITPGSTTNGNMKLNLAAGSLSFTTGDAGVQSPNSALWRQGQLSEEITLSTSGATTDSAANLLPANSIIEAVVARVTTTITTATDWEIGDTATPARFSSPNSTMTAGTTQVGIDHVDQTGATGPKQSASDKVRITTTGTPGAGKIRVTVFYRQFTAPGS